MAMSLNFLQQLLFLPTMIFLVTSCAGRGDIVRYHENGRIMEHFGTKSSNGSEVRDGQYRQWYPNSVLAQETMFAHGKKNGWHRLWYENGNRKFTCRYIDGRLDGACRAWYENGKPRLDIRFDNGKRTGEWVRTGEKVGVVARVSFIDDRLNGPMTVWVNRGYGNGSGRSLELEARFHKGRLISSFHFKEADPSGNYEQLRGTILADNQLRVEEKKNLTVYPNGELMSFVDGVETTYTDIDHFFSSKINDRIMPMFTLEFCGIQT